MGKKISFNNTSEAQRKAIAISYARKATKEKANNFDGMHLAKIKNRYLFNSDNPLGEHTYAVYVDDTTNEVRAVPTTHLYVPDKKNFEKLNKGLLYKVKFAGYETPSGVHNHYYAKDIKGNRLVLSNDDIRIDKTPLPSSQAKAIRNFAKYERRK